MSACSSKRFFSLVYSATQRGGIGVSNGLPWHIRTDLSFFKCLTSNTTTPQRMNAVIMGRKTWESIPASFRPLSGRLNVILTSQDNFLLPAGAKENVWTVKSLEEALHRLNTAEHRDKVENIFVIGGAQLLNEAMARSECFRIVLTQILKDIHCDVFVHPIDRNRFELAYVGDVLTESNGIPFQFLSFENVNAMKEGKAEGIQFPSVIFPATVLVKKEKKEQETQEKMKEEEKKSLVNNTVNDSHNSCSHHCSPHSAGTSHSSATASALPSDTATPSTSASALPVSVTCVSEPRHEEYQYLDLVQRVIESGNDKGDRTGVGTLSMFGASMRFSLRSHFPLLTTKRVFWRGVAEELLWFIRGSTDSKLLSEKNVHIWDDNGSRAFLDKLGFKDREEGDLGPVYGFQWRHFGAAYGDCHTDYTGKGVDQLHKIIELIKNSPNDRRMLMSAWNPADLHKMALPPCHVLSQFYVHNGELSCLMFQRSCDLGLGVPFNIASYALLTVMLAHVTGLRAGDFVHVLGDAHVYKNHIDPLKQQLQRIPRPFPILKIKRNIKNIDDFTMDDFQLIGYQPHEQIKMQMAV